MMMKISGLAIVKVSGVCTWMIDIYAQKRPPNRPPKIITNISVVIFTLKGNATK